jgi:hypothetical protein
LGLAQPAPALLKRLVSQITFSWAAQITVHLCCLKVEWRVHHDQYVQVGEQVPAVASVGAEEDRPLDLRASAATICRTASFSAS